MSRRTWIWVGQGALALLVGLFLVRTLQSHWSEFTGLEAALDLRWGMLLLSGAVVLVTYGLLIEAWRRVLAGWGSRLSWTTAASIWSVSNLGRYLPGKLWTVAGLALLARRAGADAWAATAAAATMQVLALGSGIAVVLVVVPSGTGIPLGGAAAASLAVLAAVVFALVSPSLVARLDRLVPRLQLRPLPAGAVIAGAVAATAAWFGYGVAFWLLARGLFPAPAIGILEAIGAFTAGYIVGFVALFAPGGAGVREATLIGLLTPALGLPRAVALSVASRLVLTLAELGAALAGIALRRQGNDRQAHETDDPS